MYIFYTFAGVIIGILAVLMLKIPSQSGSEGIKFNIAKRYMSIMFLLTSVSMFLAQLEVKLDAGQFEKLNAGMLLLFFLVGQGILFAILTLYNSSYADSKYLRRVTLPVLPLFAVYAVLFVVRGDVRVYSVDEFFRLLPDESLLILRCVIFVAVLSSMLYSAVLCHKAKAEYNRLIVNNFSETDFVRSIWLAKLLALGETVAIWVLLTYFYTTPVLEVVSGTIIIVVFILYLREFREYIDRYESLCTALADGGQYGNDCSTDAESLEISRRLHEWISREDKPFTRARITIGDVAKDMSLPKHRLSRYINREEGNFCAWINKLRIEEAAHMLACRKDLSVSDIAEITGFCDLPAFSRSFKKIKGVPPKIFKSTVRK